MAFSFFSLAFLACKPDDTRLAALEKRVETLEQQRPAPRPRPDPNVVASLPPDALDVKRGSGKAVLIEAFDFACPYCAMSAKLLDELVEKHGNEITVVSKQFVVHPDTATLPALATCAATKQNKGPQYESALWKLAWKWETGSPRFDSTQTQALALETLAKDLSLDVPRFKKDLEGDECKTYRDRQQQLLVQAGVRGTPTIFVNGKQYQGPRTVEALRTALLQ